MAPKAPHYTPVRCVSVPIYKTFTIPASTSRSWFAAFAPYNDWLGLIYYQAVSIPDGTTVPVGYTELMTDPTLTSALTPYTDAGANFGGVPTARVTDFCVEMTCSQALASVGGAVRVGRWQNGGIGFFVTETAAQFGLVNDQFRATQPEVLSFGELVAGKCIHGAMRDRTALEFWPVRAGSAAWKNIYGVNDSPTDDAVADLPAAQAELRRMSAGVLGVPWEPLIVQWNGVTTPEITFTIRGTLEVAPVAGSVLYRLAKIPASPAVDEEAKWWAHCRQMQLSKVVPVGSGVSRTTAGYLGTQPAKAAAKPKAKPPRANKNNTRTRANATGTDDGWKSSLSGMQAAAALGGATAALMSPYGRRTMRPVTARFRAAVPPRQDLRRRR